MNIPYVDPMGYVYMFELIAFNINKESFWRPLFGSGGIWQFAWVQYTMTWTILDTRRYIVSKTGAESSLTICLIAGWYFFRVLISCLVNSLFAKRLTAAETSMSTQHHRSSSLLASSLQCWRCRDLGRSSYCWWTISFTSRYGTRKYPIKFTGFHTCQLVVWDLWTIKQYWEITGGSVFFYPFPKICVGFSILTWPNSSSFHPKMQVTASLTTLIRFHILKWSNYNMDSEPNSVTVKLIYTPND